MAKLLLNPPNFLLLDEPTTHLDIQSREALQDALKEFKGTICLVSHDIEFLRAVSEQIYEVSPKGFRKFHGDYEYYRHKLERRKSRRRICRSKNTSSPVKEKDDTEPSANSESAAERKERKRREAENRKQLSKLKGPLEKKVVALEAKIAELEEVEEGLIAQFDENLAGDKFKEVNDKLMATAHEKEEVELEWEQASTELEELLENYGSSQ